jgi:phosphatidylinositol alpha-1,6-mannosyltransferase
VVLTGSVPLAELPAHYAAGDVFAMPCRTRHRGLDVEGLGIVYLEASACGLPVVAGRSGGAPDAVQPGVTGHVVDGTDEQQLTDVLLELLGSPDERARLGAAGCAWVSHKWTWEHSAERLREIMAT